jgi:hypothetical protein
MKRFITLVLSASHSSKVAVPTEKPFCFWLNANATIRVLLFKSSCVHLIRVSW